jgi:hypothetical protein
MLNARTDSPISLSLPRPPCLAWWGGVILVWLMVASGPAYAQDSSSLWRREAPAREWEFEKHQRLAKAQRAIVDSVMRVYRHRLVLSVGYNALFIPSAYSAAADLNTGVDLRQRPLFPGFNIEYFVGQHTRLSLDLGLHRAPMNMNVSFNTRRLRGGGGTVIPMFLQVKQNLPLFGQRTGGLGGNPPPEVYGLLGMGLSMTALLEIRGRIDTGSQPNTKSYTQMKPVSVAGLGVFQRLGRYFMADFSLSYQFAQPYEPAIGSISAYSGLRANLRVGLLLGGGFAKAQRRLSAGQ